MKKKGIKFSSEKTMMRLIDFNFIDGIGKVLTFGAKKYSPENWKNVPREEYESALLRHISSYMQGEKIDSDSKLPHSYHIAVNMMFLDWFDRQ